jgi:hypothetical protein
MLVLDGLRSLAGRIAQHSQYRRLRGRLWRRDARLEALQGLHQQTLTALQQFRREVQKTGDQARWLEAGDLRALERKVYSQNGEDGILGEIFRRIGTTHRYFVEFGVETGRECNSARLVFQEQWRGLFSWKAIRPCSRNCSAFIGTHRVFSVRAQW